MRHYRFRFPTLLLASSLALSFLVVGCTGGTNPPEANCGDAGCELAATPESTPENPTPSDFNDPCVRLELRSCGDPESGVSCADSAGCTAATLLSTYEPESCFDALDDPARYPACEANSCERLVQRTCGDLTETAPCIDDSGCTPSRRLWDRAEGVDGGVPDTDALQSCASALEDEVFFPSCL